MREKRQGSGSLRMEVPPSPASGLIEALHVESPAAEVADALEFSGNSSLLGARVEGQRRPQV